MASSMATLRRHRRPSGRLEHIGGQTQGWGGIDIGLSECHLTLGCWW